MFVNLNSVYPHELFIREFISSFEVIFSDIGYFNIIMNIRTSNPETNEYGIDTNIFNAFRVGAHKLGTTLLKSYMVNEYIEHIQITKTFMGDVVLTMFGEGETFLLAAYINEVMEIFNRPTLFI